MQCSEPATASQADLPGLPDRLALQLDTLAHRLASLGMHAESRRLLRCQTPGVIRVCRSCQTRYPLPWHCNMRICPYCQRRLAMRRSFTLRHLIPLLNHPVHAVLTVRNPTAISPEYLASLQAALRKLRRKRLAMPWHGGTWSLEITNESRGWHPHYHLLVDTRWIDPVQLSQVWASLVGQDDFAIVAVRGVATPDYAHEVAKYVAKPDQIASWPDEELEAYLRAIRSTRAWGTWGNVRKLWPKAQRLAQAARTSEWACAVCGSSEAEYQKPVQGVELTCDSTPYSLLN